MTTRADAAPARPSRALAPDLARGAMLLFIALANVPHFLWAGPADPVSRHPLTGDGLDRFVQGATSLVIDQKVYPMFAFLFGYGMIQFVAARRAAAVPLQRLPPMLRRRHLWLVLLGFLHAALLFQGDILAAYGLWGLLLVALLFDRDDRDVVLVVAACVGLLALSTLLALLAGTGGTASGGGVSPLGPAAQGDYLAAAGARLAHWTLVTLLHPLTPVIPAAILLGWLAARHRVLEEPGRHRRLLGWAVAAGLPLGWLVGGLRGAVHLDLLPGLESRASFLTALTSITGLVAGVGYVALFTLVAHAAARRARRRRGVVAGPVAAVAALGKCSLSGYLAQSVVFAPLLCAWGLGWGAGWGSAAAAALAVGVWVLSVVIAAALERTGRPGPAEVVLRRLTYGRARGAGSAVSEWSPPSNPPPGRA